MATETSQSFLSQATGSRRTGLDGSWEQRRPFASANPGPNSIEEMGEEDEVEQLMHNYENLLGGGDPNLARLRQRIHRVTEQTDNSESNSTSRFERISRG